jgi:3,5-epimerase/4-reductase
MSDAAHIRLHEFGRAVGNKYTVLVYGGANGWIGQQVVEMLAKDGHTVEVGRARLENTDAVRAEFDLYRPQRVINCAGVTGRPNVDWCESNRQQTVRVNVLGTVALADLCWQRQIHLTNFATGCLYSGDTATEFSESDAPNFVGSAYSRSKALAERLIFDEGNYGSVVLQLRLRMPISDDLNARSFVTKISRYERVVDVANSVTVLHDLLPIGLDLCLRGFTGIYNFVNPGHVSHNQVLALYKKHVAPDFQWRNFTVEEQSRILKAGRSNCVLSTAKLLAEYPDIPHAHEAVENCMRRIAASKK